MSSENRNREQARQLLRAMTDIDDRFLLEAMTKEEKAVFSAQTPGEAESSGQMQKQTQEPADGTVSELSGKTSGKAETPSDGMASELSGQPETENRAKTSLPRRSRLRRYSTWALTAAACLTVVIIGRYVSVESVKNAEKAPTALVEMEDKKSAPEAEAGENAAEEAAESAAKNAAEEAGKNENAAENIAEEAGKNENAAENAAGEADREMAADAEEFAAVAEAEDAEEVPMNSAAEASGQDTGITAADQAAKPSSDLAVAAADAAGAGVALSVPNPFIDAKTLEEAEEAAGFSITLPEVKEPYDTVLYRAMKDQMIEVIWFDEYNRELYRIRKGKNLGDDISGVIYEYAVSDTLESGDLKITVTGEGEGEWGTAVWTQDAEDGTQWSWSVSSGRTSMTEDEILRFVSEMMEQS